MSQLCAIVRFRKVDTRLFCEYSFVPAQFSMQGQTVTIERDFPLAHVYKTLVEVQKQLRFLEITPSPRIRHARPAAFVIDIGVEQEEEGAMVPAALK